jgi:hypothetical protein
MDYQGRLGSGTTTEKHDGKPCAPAGPVTMYSGRVQKYLHFPLDYRAAGIMVHPSAGAEAYRNHTKK